jgi:hypothetical protein
MRGPDDQQRGVSDFSAQRQRKAQVAITGGTAGGTADSEYAGGSHVAGPGEITPQAQGAEFPPWRTLTRAGYTWITMWSGPQEHHGPKSQILRTLSAPTIGELAGKLRFQAHLDGLTPDQLAALRRELRRPAPDSSGGAMMTIDEVSARHTDLVIRREGFTWVATDPEGIMPLVESGRLDFLGGMLGGTGNAG